MFIGQQELQATGGSGWQSSNSNVARLAAISMEDLWKLYCTRTRTKFTVEITI